MYLAANGEEAIYQASLQQPDVVVLDLATPGINGFETLARLHEWYTEPRLTRTEHDYATASADSGSGAIGTRSVRQATKSFFN